MIESKSNPLIRELMALKKSKVRRKTGRYLAEGKRLTEDALRSGKVELLVMTEAFASNYRKGSISSILVSEQLFSLLSDTESPQGVLAVCEMDPFLGEEELLTSKEFCLPFLNRIQDPGNLGTIIRSAEAFGVERMILQEGTVDPFNEKVIRASMGSIFRMRFHSTHQPEEFLQKCKDSGYRILGADMAGDYSIDQYPDRGRTILLIGNEANGLDQELRPMIDDFLKIPMKGRAESLNASVAASILLYEIMKWGEM